MRIFVDMDGTLAKWNNVEYEQLFEKGYYRNLEANRELVDEVNSLIKQGEDVYILSCYLTDSEYAFNEKKEWIKEYLPEFPEEKYILIPYSEPELDKDGNVIKDENGKVKMVQTNKAEYLKEHYSPITSQDYLIDDYTKNLLEWKEFGGVGVKYLNGINHTKRTWNGLMLTSYSNNEKLFELNLNRLVQIEKTYHYNDRANLPLIHFEKQYSEMRYPTLSQCRDFEDLISELNTNTLDDMEYTIYLYDETNKLPEICERGDNAHRINEKYIEWYEGLKETKDLVSEIQNELISNNEELEEQDLCDYY